MRPLPIVNWWTKLIMVQCGIHRWTPSEECRGKLLSARVVNLWNVLDDSRPSWLLFQWTMSQLLRGS